MIIKQFYLGCLAHASYLVVDERTKTAAVVDPQRDVDQYVAEAERLGAKIKYVLLTHFHADFVAGHLELRDRLGARIYIGAKAEAEYDATNLADGDVLEFGDVRLEIMETPGHTPEGISIAAYDLAASDVRPRAVFTGDTLFVGDVGRPDLLGSIGFTAEQLASQLYDSLHGKLMKLPDETVVYPAHGAGSLCGKALGKENFSTIGEQRRFNYALQPMSREEFTRIVTADQPDAPAYFLHDAILNRKERETLDTTLAKSLAGLSLDQVLALQEDGAFVVDVRPAADFEGAHLDGSVNIALEGKFATWAGTLIAPDATIVVVAEPGTEEEAAMRLGRIGLDHVAGYVKGGMAALENRPDLIASSRRVTAQALADILRHADAPLVVDVRAEKEYEGGHIAGSKNVPLNKLEARIAEVPRDSEVVVVCRSGYRSSTAASILRRHGYTHVSDLVGGMDAWSASDLPVAAMA
ncbi:MAG: rhodanese-like domain-containing protein [Planctomycetota bacterium]